MPPVQELAGSFSRQQVAWTLSLVHSRSFAQAGRHVWVPGIDMANHTLAPNATIRCGKPWGRRGSALRSWLGRMPGLPISKLQRRGALLGGCTAA